MKNKTLIKSTIKYFLYTLLCTVIFIGCVTDTDKQNMYNSFKDVKYITIDSCEYLFIYNSYQRKTYFTHSGQCKYCKAHR